MPELKYRISVLTLIFMLLISGTLEILQLLLDLSVVLSPLTILIGIIGMAILSGWFMALKISIMNGKYALLRLLTIGGSWAAAVVPFVNALPEMTTAVVLTFVTSRIEDKMNYEMQVAAYRKRQEEEARAQLQVREQMRRMQQVANDNAEEEERQAA